jgi:hypothetical protein
MNKSALLPELARLVGAEAPVRKGIGTLEAGAKKVLNTPIPGTPELLPGKITGPLRKGVDFAIENPEVVLGTATPIPGGGALAHAGKRALESGINKLSPKVAFSVSQYSGPLNPVITSGASGIPARRGPQLTAAIQKVAFATSAYDAGPAPTWAHGQAAPSGASLQPPRRAPRLDAAVQKVAAGAPTRGGFMMASDIPSYRPPRLDQAIQKDSAFENGDKSEPYTSIFKGAKRVKLEGDALIEVDKDGKSLGKGNLLKEKDSDALPEGIVMQPWDSFKRSKYAAMSTEKMASFVRSLKEAHEGTKTAVSQSWVEGMVNAARTTRPALASFAQRMQGAASYLPEGESQTKRLAAHVAAKTRGINTARFRPGETTDVMHPPVPGFTPTERPLSSYLRSPGVQRNAERMKGNTFRADAKKADLDKKTASARIALQEASAAMHRANEALAELDVVKEAAPGLTPQSQLAQSSRVGAPKASAPPGPSIAQIAKPAGPGFGSGIAGANKGVIGGSNIGGIGDMKGPPSV